jgi:hypothetical protein
MVRIAVALVLAVLVAAPAFAAGPAKNQCAFDITEPAAPQNDLAGFNIYIATQSGGPYTFLGTLTVSSPGGGATYATSNLCGGKGDGQYFAIAKAFDFAGNETGPSPEAPFVLDVTAPPVPTGFRVR